MSDPEPQAEPQPLEADYVPERIPDDVYAEHHRSQDPYGIERRDRS
jgi:hypothetical protein